MRPEIEKAVAELLPPCTGCSSPLCPDCTSRLCINCHTPLSAATHHPAVDRIECTCGVLYSRALIDGADPDLWERARIERLFARYGDTLILTTPLEAILSIRDAL